MKYFLLTLVLAGGFAAQAQQKQSLKDLLYSGKLKKDSTGVIRSTDDLSEKIDTTTKKPVEAVKPTSSPIVAEPVKVTGVAPVSPVANTTQPSSDVADSTASTTTAATAAPVKTNTRLWKEYIDTLTKTLKAEVMSSKQIKKGDYYVTIDYDIALDGTVNITKVTSGPESPFLQSQVQQLLEANPPRLNPYLDGSNQPKKVKRKQNFSISKD